MNNDYLDLTALTALKEGTYQDCTLVRIDVTREGSKGLDYLDLIFQINGHSVVDRVFGNNNPRLQSLIKSLMPYVPDGQLNLSAWRNVRCNLKLKNYVSGVIEYQQTFDWDWINPSNRNLTTSSHVSPNVTAPSTSDKVHEEMFRANDEDDDPISSIDAETTN
ncbi:hypothetical protein [Levilactobacillus parabrevis]|uniref:Uncharacterized protein n=1 Tax=Levilactobacillus parabrevis ATCC 53295 TaxID=1267003 RepID=A0A0R1GZ72_9LACO|nr:hypothetical protein [Levilactobacillus parabrevis]KRK36330.1 hypothetical protein FD07_GL000890 [Levilactobacillus parabrevis ATCC 53295]KRO05734.1 hypothetical protein IV61_GL000956 [Levilactobacillus parabrevis]